MEKKFCVYKHTSPSGKVYIGITSMKPEHRWNHGKGYATQSALNNAIKKYGWDNISHEILFSELSKEEAFKKERELISKYHATDPKYGYNMCDGGGMGCIGYHRTDEQKQNIREKMKNRVFTETHRKRISESRKGKPISEEQKKQISKTLKGKYYGHNKKAVVQIDNNTNEVIKVWDSLVEAGRALGVYPQNIFKVCQGRTKTCSGFKWKYLEDGVI